MIHNLEEFISWIDQQLNENIPNEIIAFNINIYESPFNIEIVGSNEFDLEDEDWACNEDWTPENRHVSVSNSLFGNSWESAQENITSMTKQYLKTNSENRLNSELCKLTNILFSELDKLVQNET